MRRVWEALTGLSQGDAVTCAHWDRWDRAVSGLPARRHPPIHQPGSPQARAWSATRARGANSSPEAPVAPASRARGSSSVCGQTARRPGWCQIACTRQRVRQRAWPARQGQCCGSWVASLRGRAVDHPPDHSDAGKAGQGENQRGAQIAAAVVSSLTCRNSSSDAPPAARNLPQLTLMPSSPTLTMWGDDYRENSGPLAAGRDGLPSDRDETVCITSRFAPLSGMGGNRGRMRYRLRHGATSLPAGTYGRIRGKPWPVGKRPIWNIALRGLELRQTRKKNLRFPLIPTLSRWDFRATSRSLWPVGRFKSPPAPPASSPGTSGRRSGTGACTAPASRRSAASRSRSHAAHVPAGISTARTGPSRPLSRFAAYSMFSAPSCRSNSARKRCSAASSRASGSSRKRP